ncbi:MAG TPA: SUMF1/EgtB/PvdO family nonheme iron enzyme, partial [Spirochaetota bacterium]|nr:SUMF1/EgtB/PvdO family nonheme iron enzyme [Spirochaetota bacterium]
KEGKTPCYYTDAAKSTIYRTNQVDILSNWVDWNADGYRLPTEAEWEYAARYYPGYGSGFIPGNHISGDTSGDYSVSVNISTYAWYSSNNVPAGTKTIATKTTNGAGLYDMSGNVWEWCWDRYGAYTGGAKTDPLGPGLGDKKVLRSGCYQNPASTIQCCARSSRFPLGEGSSIGFRFVCLP